MSYARAGEMIPQLELEVAQLLAKAEQADATPLQDGLTIPAEIARRQERKAALARAHARYIAQLAEHEAKLAARAAKKERAEKSAANRRPRPRPSPRINTTSPTPKAGS